jgi:putative MATE family efflux protein
MLTRTRDLTQGSIFGHFRALAVPAAVGMVFSTLYNVVDVYFAGLLHTEAQAGLSIAFQAFFVLFAVGIGLGAAMGALVGNAIGARDRAGARLIVAQGLAYGLIATLALMAFGAWMGPRLIVFLSTEGGYRDAGIAYFNILLLAVPGFVLAFGANGILQAQGDTVSMQFALIAAFLVNCGLDPLLMFGIPGIWGGIGFDGIALATVISQTGVMLYVIARALRTDLGKSLAKAAFRPQAGPFRQITLQLLPTSFAMIVMISAGFVIQYYLKSFGEPAVAAYGIALRVEQLFLLPVFGLTGALLPIVAQNFGAGQPDRVRTALFDCWKLGLAFMCVACPVLWFAAGAAMRGFSADHEVIRIGVSYLHVDGVILPAYMMLFAINAFLQALRKPIWTVWIGIYRQAIAVAVFVWIYVAVFGLGIWGVWFGVATSVLTGLMLSLFVAHLVAKPLIGGLFGQSPPGVVVPARPAN